MTSSNSSSGMAFPDSVETSSDLILKRLPLHVIAQTSILSRTWRHNWLTWPDLMFDDAFWKKLGYNWRKGSSVISNVLFLHNGSIHSFLLQLRPSGMLVEKNTSLSQWLSILSRSCPKNIALTNWVKEKSDIVCMPSYIFHCTELTKLRLVSFVLYAPPFDFKGFPYLRTLELLSLDLKLGVGMLRSLISKCPCLVYLRIELCSRMDLRDVDAPRLEKLIIIGRFNSLSLKNCPRLADVSLCSTKSRMNGTETVVATIKSLATSYKLKRLVMKGNLCKFLAAGGLNKSLPLAFNHLIRLYLEEVMLSDPDVFCFTIGMIQSCPFVEKLVISVSSITAVRKCNGDNRMLGMLHEVKITGITGSIDELKLLEYVLSVSEVLEKLFYNFAKDASEIKVTRELIRFPRASPKVQLICLD